MQRILSNAGMTLLEVIVVVSILSILTLIITSGLPLIRDQQALENEMVTINALLQQAQQRALSEIRDSECIELLGLENDSDEGAAACSNTGIALTEGSLVIFSDLDNNQEYSDTDYVADQVSTRILIPGDSFSILFHSTPPASLVTYVNGNPLSPQDTTQVEISSGQASITATIHPYGIITVGSQ